MRRVASGRLRPLAILCAACAAALTAVCPRLGRRPDAATVVSASVGAAPDGPGRSGPASSASRSSTPRCTSTPAATRRTSTRCSSPCCAAWTTAVAAVLRVGGNSADQTWWPMRGVIPPGGNQLRAEPGLDAGGPGARPQGAGTKLILGINLAADRPALAAAEARALVHGVGRGADRSARDRQRARPVPGLPVVTGTAGAAPSSPAARGYSLRALIVRGRPLARGDAAAAARRAGVRLGGLDERAGSQFLSAVPGITQVTFHRYALRGCATDPADPSYASIANLLADRVARPGPPRSSPRSCRSPTPTALAFRLDELNSASCRGRSRHQQQLRLGAVAARHAVPDGRRRRRRGQPPHPARERRTSRSPSPTTAAAGTAPCVRCTTARLLFNRALPGRGPAASGHRHRPVRSRSGPPSGPDGHTRDARSSTSRPRPRPP